MKKNWFLNFLDWLLIVIGFFTIIYLNATIGTILLIAFAILYFVFEILLPILHPIKHENLSCYVGSIGTGKTRISTDIIVSEYRKRTKISKYLRYLPFVHNYFSKLYKPNAKLYSTIPIQYGKKVISIPLELDHILMKKKLEEGSCVFMDEIGQVCSQWQFDNPKVQINIQCFIRFFRHFVDGFIICTDQSETNIVKQIRCRLNKVYHIDSSINLPFNLCRYAISEMIYSETMTQTLDPKIYYHKFNPRIHYDSRCYSIAYENGFVKDPNVLGLKTNYFIDVSTSKAEKQAYKNEMRDLVTRKDMQ